MMTKAPRVLLALGDVERFGALVHPLRERGARTTRVAPGATALVAADELTHDVAVVDADHPAACATVLHLSELPSGPRTLVIGDDADSPAVARCLVAGADDILDASGPVDELVAQILDESTDAASTRLADIAARRRDALTELAALEAARPRRPTVRVTALERVPARGQRREGPWDRLHGIGPSQRRVVEGLLEGDTCQEIAAKAGVSPSAIYGAKRRLARRLDVPVQQLTDCLRDVSRAAGPVPWAGSGRAMAPGDPGTDAVHPPAAPSGDRRRPRRCPDCAERPRGMSASGPRPYEPS